ncbi:MAG: hypothetical protein HPY66_2625 [Firmicutes bacterium]|nr:hypothetical protein [Bacillota bacterium]MDI6686886.1 phospholipase D family protein [Desulfobacterales bacterium]
MSIQLVSADHEDRLQEILEGTEASLRIISPFIGLDISKRLAAILEINPAICCEIITRFSREDFVNGASSLYALKSLNEAGVTIYALQGLHTKLYLIDNAAGMLGSANFTSGGFRLNHELSIFVRDEADILADMHSYYNDTLTKIQEKGDYKVTAELIQSEIEMVNKLRKDRKDKTTKYRNEHQFGAILNKGDELVTGGNPDTIQTILASGVKDGITEGIWLKFEGDAENREGPEDRYEIARSAKLPTGFTSFPAGNKPSGMKPGDYIYLAIIGTDGRGNSTPVIMGRARTKGFFKENIADEEMKKEFDWMWEYPAFVELYDAEFLDTPQKNGISLLDLLADVGTGTYPSTIGTAKTPIELRSIHYQKSHIRITHQAKAYLDSRFEQAAKTYGVIKYT